MKEIKNLLLTGSAGHTGKGVASILSKHYLVNGFDINPSPTCQESILGDVTNIESCREAVQDMDAVIINHMATRNPDSYSPPFVGYDINVRGTANVYQACLEHEVRKVILISSVKTFADTNAPTEPLAAPGEYVYGSGGDIYSVTKIMQEVLAFHYFKKHGIVTTVIRPAWVVYEDEEQSTSKGDKQVLEFDKFMIDPRDLGEVVAKCLARENKELEAYIVGQPEYQGVKQTMELLEWAPQHTFDKLRNLK